jgi:ice-binding like protein/exosortase sorting signal-containing protein
MTRTGWRLIAIAGFAALLCGASVASAQTAPPLGAAQSFAVLGGSAVTNTGPSVVNGDLGISPNGASSVTGFPPGLIAGTTHAADGVALNAQNAMTSAYNALFAQPCNTTFGVPTDIGGTTLTPGVYCFASSAQITGDLTLNALGNPDAVFIFKTGTSGASTLTTAPGSRVLLINGTQPCNVFWAVSSSATVDSTSTFVGNILAQASISVNNGAHLFGRALAKAAVTLINDVIDATVCAGLPPPPGPTPAPTPGPAACVTPTITSIPSQAIPVLPVHGTLSVGFTIGGGVITDALSVSATSSDTQLVPPSGMVITKGVGGARVLTIVGADGRSGVATITVTVTDASAANCRTSTTFQLTIGATAVPTLPQWALIVMAVLLALAGLASLRRRTT